MSVRDIFEYMHTQLGRCLRLAANCFEAATQRLGRAERLQRREDVNILVL